MEGGAFVAREFELINWEAREERLERLKAAVWRVVEEIKAESEVVEMAQSQEEKPRFTVFPFDETSFKITALEASDMKLEKVEADDTVEIQPIEVDDSNDEPSSLKALSYIDYDKLQYTFAPTRVIYDISSDFDVWPLETPVIVAEEKPKAAEPEPHPILLIDAPKFTPALHDLDLTLNLRISDPPSLEQDLLLNLNLPSDRRLHERLFFNK